jgi:hypothetical protein
MADGEAILDSVLAVPAADHEENDHLNRLEHLVTVVSGSGGVPG